MTEDYLWGEWFREQYSSIFYQGIDREKVEEFANGDPRLLALFHVCSKDQSKMQFDFTCVNDLRKNLLKNNEYNTYSICEFFRKHIKSAKEIEAEIGKASTNAKNLFDVFGHYLMGDITLTPIGKVIGAQNIANRVGKSVNIEEIFL